MESLKSYLKIYLYGLAVILMSILCVSLSGAIDPYSAKYRVKLFVLGSTLFFFGSTFFILKFSPCKIENATLKEFYKGTFESISGTAKLFQFLYAALGMALSVYIIFAEQWHLARGFAKISALLSCTLIAGSAVIRIAHSFISVPLDTGSAEKESKEPVVLLVLLLVEVLKNRSKHLFLPVLNPHNHCSKMIITLSHTSSILSVFLRDKRLIRFLPLNFLKKK